MKVRIVEQPRGYISLDGAPLAEWPPVGEVVDLPDVMANDLIAGGHAEKVSGWTGREWIWPWRRPPAEIVGPTHVSVRMIIQPEGFVSLDCGPLKRYPPVGTVLELDRFVAESLIEGGIAESVVEEPGVPTVQLRVKRAWPKVGGLLEVPEAIAATLIAAGLADDATPAASTATPGA